MRKIVAAAIAAAGLLAVPGVYVWQAKPAGHPAAVYVHAAQVRSVPGVYVWQ